jgi:uncharacterized OsmC-like protein
MSETVVVTMDRSFAVSYRYRDPEGDPAAAPAPVDGLHELTPYGMLLAGAATCASMVLLTYATNRDLPLDGVEITADYNRTYRNDCATCLDKPVPIDTITLTMGFRGSLTDEEKAKLLVVARYCPVTRLLTTGAVVEHRAAPDAPAPAPVAEGSPVATSDPAEARRPADASRPAGAGPASGTAPPADLTPPAGSSSARPAGEDAP